MWSVFFVFLSYLDRNFVKGDLLSRALDAEKESREMFSLLNATFCAKMSIVGENLLYRVSDGTEVLRSVVSPSGRLVNCSVIVNPVQVKSFVHECRLGLKEQGAGRQLDARFTRMDEAKLMCREFKLGRGRSDGLERKDEDDSKVQSNVLNRSKRGFTYPGTLWCGAGNMADNYDQLGAFAKTDSCCRTHDHCPHVIHAFSSNYGHTNFKWHSICHCDCDNALKSCLRKVNDTSSRVVGQAFFNVIGVPCFEFVYEEHCSERHWYGLCKRYEKLPIAVLKEAVPYDYGGIDVIDVLTLAPPMQKESKKSKEEKLESNSQSTVSGPEEPSLTNVVTAAEDFIKVLATVSTSQSSATDSDKDETQSSEEKKKRKNTGKKKKTKKQKGKGKGRKQKLKAEAGVKAEEGGAVSASGSKAALSNFINEPHKHEKSSRNRVGDNVYELGGKEEPSNEVMKDEPAMDKETVSVTSPTIIQRKPMQSDTDALTEEINLSAPTSTTAVFPHNAKRLRQGRRKSKKVPLTSSKETVTKTDNSSGISFPATATITPMEEPEQQNFGSNTEKRPVVSTAGSPIVIPKVKRNRSKERRDRQGRKKRRKVSSSSPIVSVAHENSFVDNLKMSPLSRTPTITHVPTTEQHDSHRSDIYAGKTMIQVPALNSTFSILKKQRSKVRGLKKRKALPPSSENPFYHNSSESVLPILTTPDTSISLISPTRTAAISVPTEKLETYSEWRLSTTAATHHISTKRHGQGQQRKPRRKVSPAALSNAGPVPEQTEHTPGTFAATSSKVTTAGWFGLLRSEKPGTTTSASPTMSPVQLSIERAKAQFTRKKRRKAALLIRQQ